ncbi:MAG: O-antigen ligase family protein [Bacteroidales bacterium]
MGLIANLIMSEYDNRRSNLYYFNIFLISISILLSATRGYILFTAFVLFFVFLIIKFRSLPKLIIGISIIALILSAFFNINKQIHYSFERFSAIEGVFNEEYETEESIDRITERGPRVMEKFKESPLIGYGFRDEYFEYADPHVGNQTLLLNGGIIGFMLYMGFIAYIVYSLQKIKTEPYIEKKYINIFTIMQFGFLGIFIIHSTSVMIFSYIPGIGFIRVVFVLFLTQYFYIKCKGKSNYYSSISIR